jgi:subtilisin-like proprotein convertase family protein
MLFSAGQLADAGVALAAAPAAPAAHGDRGVAGVASESVTVNFSDIASRDSSTLTAGSHKDIPEPGRGPRHKPVSAYDGALLEQLSAEASTIESPPQSGSPGMAQTFNALDDDNTAIPPDTNGAVGPNHLMVTLNTQIRIQTRGGANIRTVPLDSFWAALPGPWATGVPQAFDPKVLYDAFSNRWIFTAMADGDSATSAVLLAVSQTSDPMAAWRLYKVDADATDAAWADYPEIGFNKNWIVVNVNMFGVADETFKRTNIYAFNKANTYAGSRTFTLFTDTQGFAMAPAVTYDATLDTLFMVEDWDGHTQLRFSRITGTAAAPVYSSVHQFPTVAAANSWTAFAPNGDDFAPQLGSAEKIQNGDSRIQNAVYRNGSIWTVQTIFLPDAATPTHSAVQWWELGTNGVIKQRGRVNDPNSNVFYAFPSITVNKDSDVLVGYSRFSAQQYASGSYSFRGPGDPPNTLRSPIGLKLGAGPYFKEFGGGRNRWGDYSAAVVDPANDLDMWTIQEYAALPLGGVSRWGTWWGRIGPSTPVPLIQLGTMTATDSGGDPDTDLEPGESGQLTIELKNIGYAAATGVSGKLTAGIGVTVTQADSAYPNLPGPTGAGTNVTPFTVNVANTVACGQRLNFALKVTYSGAGSPRTLNFSLPCGRQGAATAKTYAGPVVAIPDANSAGVNIPLAVSGFGGSIADLNFKIGGTTCTTAAGATTVGLDHTWVGDLVISLQSPQGRVVTLMNAPGGVNNSGHNFCNTVLDDESAGASIQGITPAQAPYTGSFKPAGALSDFDGVNPNGTWVVHISDGFAGDTGNMRAFSLIITAYACSPA